MESWFGFDDEVGGGSMMRATRSSRLTTSSRTPSSAAVSHVSFLEESRRLDLQATSVRVNSTRDLGFTSRRLELAQRFRSLMRNTGGRLYDDNLNASDTTNFPHGEFDELKKNLRAVQEQNLKLQAVITDVTEVNKRWQKYNNDRQMYVQQLLSTIQDQQEQMNKIAEDRIFNSEELCNESGEAKPSGEVLVVDNVRLQEEVMLLRRRLESSEQEHREHVEVLEFQLKAHRDDWEAERSEKQQALQDKEAVDKKLRELQKDFRSLKLKYQEEKQQQHCGHCHSCGVTVGDAGQCNIFLPGSQVNVGRKGHPKTYRTSGNLLPRGTTIFYGDDLTIDGDDLAEAKVTEISDKATELKATEEGSSAHSPTRLLENLQETESTEVQHFSDAKRKTSLRDSAVEFDGNNNSPANSLEMVNVKHKDNSDSYEIVSRKLSESSYRHIERKNSSVELSLDHEECSPRSSRVSCSVLHITPSGSGSSIEPDAPPCDLGADGEGMAASGVTIGFNSSGLASVMAFSHTPIVKSSSLPVPEENRRKMSLGDGKVNPLVSRWSFDSNWSALAIASPPISQNFAASTDSLMEEMKSKKSSSAGECAPSSSGAAGVASSSSSVPIRKAPSWKMSYFDEGVATQTEENVICPGCGQVFPPKLHLKFLDHFEKCQSNEREQKRSKSRN